MQIERRYTTPEAAGLAIETRGEGDEAQAVLVGYAAVFYRAADPGTEYWIWDDLVERIMPGAFANALKEGDDARALFNHEVDNLLGLRSNGTVRLSTDKTGLKYEIDLPDTNLGRDLVELVGRGDVPGSSFAFRTWGGKRGKVTWTEETTAGKSFDIREIHDLELADVGPVTRPAYTATTTGLREAAGEQDARAIVQQRQRWRASLTEPDEVAVRAAVVKTQQRRCC
jgi:HK97 family phage prohead protease